MHSINSIVRKLKKSALLLLPLLLLLSNGCDKDGPNVAVWISNPNKGGMDGSKDGHQLFLNYLQTDKYVCFSPTDAQTIITYCQAKKKQ